MVFIVGWDCACIVYGSIDFEVCWKSYVVLPTPAKILQFR
jgi:hypothetical protein